MFRISRLAIALFSLCCVEGDPPSRGGRVGGYPSTAPILVVSTVTIVSVLTSAVSTTRLLVTTVSVTSAEVSLLRDAQAVKAKNTARPAGLTHIACSSH